MKHIEITCYMSQLSYSGTSVQQAKLSKSLHHSFRTVDGQSKSIAWDSDLSYLNKLFHNGKWEQLDDLSDLSKRKLIDSLLLPKKPTQGLTKCRQKLRAYKKKLRDFLKLNSQSSHELDYLYIEKLLAVPMEEKIDLDKWLKEAHMIDFSRKSQRIKCIEKYIKTRNLLVELPQNMNSNVIEECIFVIPHRNNISRDMLNGVEMARALIKYYGNFFKDYTIKAIAVHCDERSKNELTGEHVHLFLDTRNKKTGEYDLRLRKANLAQEVMNDFDPTYPMNEFVAGANFSFEEQSSHGHARQELFRQFINKVLLNKKGFAMEFNEYADLEIPKKMRWAGKLRKDDRSFSYLMRQQEKQLEIIKQQVINKKNERNEVNKQLESESAELLSTRVAREHEKELLQKTKEQRTAEQNRHEQCRKQHVKAQEKLYQVMQELKDKESLTKELDKRIGDLKQSFEKMTQQAVHHLTQAVQNAVKSFVLNQRDKGELQREVDKKFSQHMKQLESQPFTYSIIKKLKEVLLGTGGDVTKVPSQSKKPIDSHEND